MQQQKKRLTVDAPVVDEIFKNARQGKPVSDSSLASARPL
jgi:hypothetical protein